MAASLVFRLGFCSCHRALLKKYRSTSKPFYKPLSRLISYSCVNHADKGIDLDLPPSHDGVGRSVAQNDLGLSSQPSKYNNNRLEKDLDLDLGPVTSSSVSTESEEALHKFAKIVEKVKADQNFGMNDRNVSEGEECSDETFASMLRNSKLVSMSEAKDKRVIGHIIEVMEDDLYIDFGGKFHCVCPRPRRNADKYHRGSRVVVNLNSLEMSSAFLGSDIHITLLEADAILLGLTTAKETAPESSTR